MTDTELLKSNRVILAHFDGYSAALLFARWGKCLLAPEPLPDVAAPIASPIEIGPEYDGAAVMQAAVTRYGLNADEIVHMDDFDAWVAGEGAPIRIHTLRFTCFEAPSGLIEGHGGVFKPISELRGSAMIELNMLRQVFNLLVGGGASR